MQRKIVVAVASALFALGGLQAASAAEPTAPLASQGATTVDQRGVVENAKAEGRVTAIDVSARLITVEDSSGSVSVFKADNLVKNFDQIKVGDRISVNYKQTLVLKLQEGGSGFRERDESASVTSAPLGEKPAGSVSESTTLVANVTAVDKKKHTVTLKGPKGRVLTVKVTDPELMSKVKKGSQVVATYTETLAVKVTAVK